MSWKITVKRGNFSRPVSDRSNPVATRPRRDWPGQAMSSLPPKGSLLGLVLYSRLPTDPAVAPAWTMSQQVPTCFSGALLCASCVLAAWSLGYGAMGGCSAPLDISCSPCLTVVFLGNLESMPPSCTDFSKGSSILMSIHHCPTDTGRRSSALYVCTPKPTLPQTLCASVSLPVT